MSGWRSLGHHPAPAPAIHLVRLRWYLVEPAIQPSDHILDRRLGEGDILNRVALGNTAKQGQRRLDRSLHRKGLATPLITEQLCLGKSDICLLYTSDAADDLTRVDLAGR